MKSERSKANPMLKARRIKRTTSEAKWSKEERTGLLCEALNGDNARSVKQAILFERSEFNRL